MPKFSGRLFDYMTQQESRWRFSPSISELIEAGHLPTPWRPLIDDLAQRVSRHLAAHLGGQIRAALNDALGRSDWTPDELEGRLLRQAPFGGPETYYLDGRPLLRITPEPFDIDADPRAVSAGVILEHLWTP